MGDDHAFHGRRGRLWLLLGIGVVGVAALLLLPGPEFTPYVPPPDPAIRITADGTRRDSTSGFSRITHPSCYAEMLAYTGNAMRASVGEGTVTIEMRVDEAGR